MIKNFKFKSVLVLLFCCFVFRESMVAEYDRRSDPNLSKDEKLAKKKKQTWWEWIKKNKRWIGAGTIGAILAASKGMDVAKYTNNGIKNSGLSTGSASASSGVASGLQQQGQTLLNPQSGVQQAYISQFPEILTSWQGYLADRVDFEDNFLKIFKGEEKNIPLILTIDGLVGGMGGYSEQDKLTWDDIKSVHKMLNFNINKDATELLNSLEDPLLEKYLNLDLTFRILSDYHDYDKYRYILKQDFSDKLHKLFVSHQKAGKFTGKLGVIKFNGDDHVDLRRQDLLIKELMVKIKEKLQENLVSNKEMTMKELLDEVTPKLLDEKLTAYEMWLKDKKII